MSERMSRTPGEMKSSIDAVKREIRKTVVGYEDQIEDFLICFATRGHLLIEGVPGVAKTTLSKAFAGACALSYRRIQFTQDILPADITGYFFFNQRSNEFEVRKGPLFADFVLADEINRAPPKTQSALLEAMQERQVTIEGNTFGLPDLFTVVATLNPIETEGVYPLPEAQIDRFTIKSSMDYLDKEHEIEILQLRNEPDKTTEIVLSRKAIFDMISDVALVFAHPSVIAYIRDIARETREVEELDFGLSPRGAIHLLNAAKAHAYLRGRTYVIPDDVKDMAHRVIDHRLMTSPEAELTGVTRASITESILSSLAVPKGEFGREEYRSV